jgi:glycosyltransferase involved in cell wall biosynthesis
VIAFSSVSCGVPLWLSHFTKPKKILRLGGDFFWERYTDWGGMKSLQEFYESQWLLGSIARCIMQWILKTFDHIVFSSRLQQELYERHYRDVPPHSVIENVIPPMHAGLRPMALLRAGGMRGEALRLLFVGRFVGFKNLSVLLRAVASLTHDPLTRTRVSLTLVGDGPMAKHLRGLTRRLGLTDRVRFHPSVSPEELMRIFAEHDLLVLPSLTEISPHVALEARSWGLPVLLTDETGLSERCHAGIILRRLHTPPEIVKAIVEIEDKYELIAARASDPLPVRTWHDIAEDYLHLFR